jgi:hypothetical protein
MFFLFWLIVQETTVSADQNGLMINMIEKFIGMLRRVLDQI